MHVVEERRVGAVVRFAADARYQAPFVLGLGRIIRRKGFHLLIEAFEKCAAKDWKLVIAGEGRELETLKAQAAALGEAVGQDVERPAAVAGAGRRLHRMGR